MKKYLIFVSIIFILAALAIFSFYLTYLPKDPLSEKEALFSIEKGQGSREIAQNLERENLIKNKTIFRIYVLLSGAARNLQAGEYLLSPVMNIPQITEKLFLGERAREKVTIIEGWNLKEIGFYFEERGMFQAEELYKQRPELEGYLFPDTYWLNKGAGLEEIIGKMRDNFEKKTKDLSLTPEIVIMASLLEKEVRTLEDKKLVAGILWKRLAVGMPLQVDATIAYILGGENWNFDQMRREIARAKEIDSPYNTYKYRGLPVGPIGNPGLNSLIAALEPKESDFWYYLSTPEAETIFSRTLSEHNAAVAKYLR